MPERLILGASWREAVHFLPGLLLAVAVTLVATALATGLGRLILTLQGLSLEGRSSPVSGISMAVVLGILVANTLGTAKPFEPGLQFCVKKVLRFGIVLVGIKLSMLELLRMGALAAGGVVAVIALALWAIPALARRLGVSERMGILAAASTAICGVTATVAVAPTIEADDREVAYTIANVTLFGLCAMLAYPYLAHALFAASPAAAGFFLGTSIHDTSQVMGSALVYKDLYQSEAAVKAAAVTKLTRNLCLVGVVPLLALVWARRQGGAARGTQPPASLFPVFVLGFLAMAILRSVGDAGLTGSGGAAFGIWDAAAWNRLTRTVGETGASWALGTALAAVGLTTRFKTLKGMGLRPLYAGAAAALLVGAAGLGFAALIDR